MLPSHFYWLAAPGLPGSSGDRIIAALEKSPPRTKGRGMHHYVKNAVASQTVQYSPPGQPWGLGHDALISVTSRAVLLKETLCIFWAALLPCTKSIYLLIHIVSTKTNVNHPTGQVKAEAHKPEHQNDHDNCLQHTTPLHDERPSSQQASGARDVFVLL